MMCTKCTTLNMRQYFLCLEKCLAAIVSYSAKKAAIVS